MGVGYVGAMGVVLGGGMNGTMHGHEDKEANGGYEVDDGNGSDES